MTITGLLVFLMVSQIMLAGYLLYSLNDVEREARKRNADLRAHIDAAIAGLETRLSGGAAAARKRAAGEN
jgi:predicted component of type VI protein secretion system